MRHHWGYTLIYPPLSYSYYSLGCQNNKDVYIKNSIKCWSNGNLHNKSQTSFFISSWENQVNTVREVGSLDTIFIYSPMFFHSLGNILKLLKFSLSFPKTNLHFFNKKKFFAKQQKTCQSKEILLTNFSAIKWIKQSSSSI